MFEKKQEIKKNYNIRINAELITMFQKICKKRFNQGKVIEFLLKDFIDRQILKDLKK